MNNRLNYGSKYEQMWVGRDALNILEHIRYTLDSPRCGVYGG